MRSMSASPRSPTAKARSSAGEGQRVGFIVSFMTRPGRGGGFSLSTYPNVRPLHRAEGRGRLDEHRPDCRDRQIEMKRVVLQRDETVLQVEALRVIVLGKQVYRKNANPFRHVAGRFQEVKEE